MQEFCVYCSVLFTLMQEMPNHFTSREQGWAKSEHVRKSNDSELEQKSNHYTIYATLFELAGFELWTEFQRWESSTQKWPLLGLSWAGWAGSFGTNYKLHLWSVEVRHKYWHVRGWYSQIPYFPAYKVSSLPINRLDGPRAFELSWLCLGKSHLPASLRSIKCYFTGQGKYS